ncbi:hypothetical protein X777_01368 [Ooceraea biroi]|uniref:Uncharacterized protein n=1 Tax=Ooceraea biroi TaxID=2015173 RepID=A0A026WRU9_OOCBI|nr:hypothetical protein X777_01368 [Ooceraea biroi]
MAKRIHLDEGQPSTSPGYSTFVSLNVGHAKSFRSQNSRSRDSLFSLVSAIVCREIINNARCYDYDENGFRIHENKVKLISEMNQSKPCAKT